MKLQRYKNFETYHSKKVSFIITTKNRADYLDKMLELHRDLIHPDDELIIIDGNSTDHTHEIVNKYADIVDTFISEPDLSGAHALNKGILISRGKYIKQLPDDDMIYPEAMEQAIQVLEAHPEVDVLVCGGTRQIGEHYSNVYFPPGVNYGKRVEDVFKYGACGTGFIIRRSSLSTIGILHPTDVAADKEFVLKAISRGANVKFCRIRLFNHPIYDHSVTIYYRREHELACDQLLKQYCSSRFYRWYRMTMLRLHRLRQLLRRYPRLNSVIEPILHIVKKIRGRKQSKLLWDGGFS